MKCRSIDGRQNPLVDLYRVRAFVGKLGVRAAPPDHSTWAVPDPAHPPDPSSRALFRQLVRDHQTDIRVDIHAAIGRQTQSADVPCLGGGKPAWPISFLH